MAKSQKKPGKKPAKRTPKAMASTPILIPSQTVTVMIPGATFTIPAQSVSLTVGTEPVTVEIPSQSITTPSQSVNVEIPGMTLTAPEGDCCTACHELETGHWGFAWQHGSGSHECLEGPTGKGVVKVLKGDADGPFWANP